MRSAQKQVQLLLTRCATASAQSGSAPTSLSISAPTPGLPPNPSALTTLRHCFITHESSHAMPAAGQPAIPHPGACPACSSIGHQRAHMLANVLSQQPRHFSQTPLASGPATPAQQHSFSLQPGQAAMLAPQVTALKAPVRSQSSALLPMDAAEWIGSTGASLPTPAVPTSVHTALQQLNIFGPAYTRGWAQHITWGAPAIALTSALVATELLLLPSLAPGGASFGILAVEGVAQCARIPTDLASLLAASEGLEAVQAFSFARKVAQGLLFWSVIQAVTGRRLPYLMGMKLSQPMDKAKGWYRWACIGLLGLATVNLVSNGCSYLFAQLPESLSSLSSGAALQPLEGDERTLPFRCRWWVDTCLVVPLLEEAVFRGFVLTSLTRFMPVGAALLTSSTAFALCHLGHASVWDLPQLVAMGVVLGMVFVRSRNLVAPVVAHSLNNTGAWIAENL